MATNKQDGFEAPIQELEKRIETLSGMGDDDANREDREKLERELAELRSKVFELPSR